MLSMGGGYRGGQALSSYVARGYISKTRGKNAKTRGNNFKISGIIPKISRIKGIDTPLRIN